MTSHCAARSNGTRSLECTICHTHTLSHNCSLCAIPFTTAARNLGAHSLTNALTLPVSRQNNLNVLFTHIQHCCCVALDVVRSRSVVPASVYSSSCCMSNALSNGLLPAERLRMYNTTGISITTTNSATPTANNTHEYCFPAHIANESVRERVRHGRNAEYIHSASNVAVSPVASSVSDSRSCTMSMQYGPPQPRSHSQVPGATQAPCPQRGKHSAAHQNTVPVPVPQRSV